MNFGQEDMLQQHEILIYMLIESLAICYVFVETSNFGNLARNYIVNKIVSCLGKIKPPPHIFFHYFHFHAQFGLLML